MKNLLATMSTEIIKEAERIIASVVRHK